jgi:hypothetical protein
MTVVLTVCVLALVGWVAAAAAEHAATEQPVATAPAADGPELPAEAPDADQGDPALDPDLGLMPEPEATCKFHWCSSDAQCVEWFGPGSECYIQQGQSCGQCIF